MTLTDISRGKYSSFEAKSVVWGEEADIFIDFPDSQGKEDEYLAKYMLPINQKLEWIENNRQAIEQALLDDGMLSLAEDWAAGAERAEDEEQECYIMEDGQKVFLPISSESFCKSLYIESIALSCDKESTEAELILLCRPDYFAGHCIMATVDKDNQVECNSLAG